MTGFKRAGLAALCAVALLCAGHSALAERGAEDKEEKIVQAQVVLTVSESKRLIAKAVAQMPIVKEALANGMVIITKGTTTSYVAEEILGKKIEHGAFVYGRVYPAKGGKELKPVESVNEVILIRGKLQEGIALADAVKMLKPGDVVIKGANALDYENKIAAGIVSGPTCGTTGTIMPYVIGANAHLVIPVGLEKQVAGNVIDITNKVREPIESINEVYPMYVLTGHIVTEIEAMKTLADVLAFQVAAGGIGGAEGSVRLVCRGTRKQVEKALKIVDQIQGEPPFVE